MTGVMHRDVTEVFLGFARTLRAAGVDASTQRCAALLDALAVLDVTDPRDAYWAGRTTLCGSADDIAVYDAAFAAYFGGRAPKRGGSPVDRLVARHGGRVAPATGSQTSDEEAGGIAVTASDTEVLRHRDIAALSAADRAEVRRLIGLLTPGCAPRPGRRRRPAGRGEADRARTVRAILRGGGEVTRLARRRPRPKARRLVLLIDVSGSMAGYADALLRFAHAAVRSAPLRTEVFTFGTRMTRVTRALRHRDPDSALAAAGGCVPDWHGGTRLAEALRAFLERWGRRGTARGAVVVLCSDGWERGDPALLAEQTQWLARLAYTLFWVNPHRGKPGYAPLAGGMAACLPHVDEFVAGHNLAAYEHLVEVISHA
ncbi:MAG: VWA domain-containing protein [Hamadaea sp.]|nr:VWA domain-containing protein [Hamadaea sp.]